jgi:uncharacterized protein (DUF1697 family)
MTTYVALLRGINVGGNKMVSMAELRVALEKMGLSDVRTLLQSGNVVFRSGARAGATLEQSLERELEKRLKCQADFHIRTATEWQNVVARNPFPEEAGADPSRLLVMFFKAPLDKVKVKALQAAIPGRERVHADGRHLYAVFPDGQGTSKLPPMIDRMLGARGTGRNWNTVLKLSALSGA